MRKSGILMPVASLPGPYGIGSLGKPAFAFIDFLKKAGQKVWQMLPLSPTGFGDSPYQSCSAFAGNPYFIDLDILRKKGLLKKGEYGAKECCTNEGAVDYAALYHSRYGVLRKAFARFSTWYPDDYYRFCYEQGWWLEDYALYMTAKGLYEGKSYLEWPEPVRSHTPEAIRQLYAEHEAEIHFWKFCQYEFSLQWTALKAYAGENGIEIMGDIPIYVAADSADVWAAPELFLLDACGAPKEVAGCPPDAFSDAGQLWGNPLYNWDVHLKTGCAWWIRRLRHASAVYDVVRIDHFRGFESYYAIPARDKTAVNGVWRKGPGTAFIDRLTNGFAVFGTAFANPLPSFHPVDLLIGLSAGVLLKLAVYIKGKNRKKFRQGEEYGSARWGKPEDIKPYMDPEFSNNVILTQTEFLTMNSRPKQPKYARNKNILVIGGSGSGKTRFFVKPNLMQMHSSYVVTDPKGTVLVECGKMLEKGGYVIKSLNTINFRKSMHYNPFSYIRSEKDILKLVNTIIVNTKGDGDKSGEDFWVKAEKLYYTALIGYIWYEAPDHEKNFTTLLEMINASEAREDDETFKNPVDVMFDELEARDPDHFAVKQYRKYKLAAGKTAKSILISCGARLAPFDIAELRELMSYDEMELDTIGDRKTALFVIISDTDDTFNFVVAIMYSQLFNLLCDKADDVYNGRLPVHVRCLLDEFANIGQIPKFDKLIATIRSREISASIILQSQSQLKTIYKDAADTITGNCDCTLFLGGKEKSTLKEISEVLGKETIDLYNTSETRSNNNSYGLNYQKTGKELMSQDEIAVMDGAKCILQLRGVRPFLSNKYDITKHPKYRQLSDYNKRNAFDIEKYRQHKLVVKPDDTFDLYDMGEVEAD